jgi:cobalt/nickel transport system permease protein
MTKTESSLFDISYLDTLPAQGTLLNRLDPRVKVLTTLAFVFTIVSFGKYEITGLLPFTVYPVVLIAVGNLPLIFLLKRLLLAVPFVLFVGIFNPFLDREILISLGPIGISGGWISFASIMIRFVLTVLAALILVASTGFHSVCMALGRFGVPSSLVVQLLFLFRYVFVLIDEASRMVRARSLRSFGKRGMGIKVFSSMVGQLLLRTLDRAQRIHSAMLCRGFDGEIRVLSPMKLGLGDVSFFLGWSCVFFLMRMYDIPEWLGRMSTELIG